MFSILSRAFQVAAICAKTPASKRRKPGRWTLSSDDAYESEKRGGPDRIDLILVPPRELVERNELNAVARADGVRGVARQPRSRRSCQAHPRAAGACRQGDRMRRGLRRGPGLPPET